MITTQTVWTAYQALRRYVEQVGTVSGAPVPPSLSPHPQGKSAIAVEGLVADLARVWVDEFPLPLVSRDYFSYLYLFCQL